MFIPNCRVRASICICLCARHGKCVSGGEIDSESVGRKQYTILSIVCAGTVAASCRWCRCCCFIFGYRHSVFCTIWNAIVSSNRHTHRHRGVYVALAWYLSFSLFCLISLTHSLLLPISISSTACWQTLSQPRWYTFCMKCFLFIHSLKWMFDLRDCRIHSLTQNKLGETIEQRFGKVHA